MQKGLRVQSVTKLRYRAISAIIEKGESASSLVFFYVG